jgi:hypothetical protein
VFDGEAGIFDDGETGGASFFSGGGVGDVLLEPENFGADGDGGIGDGRDLFGAAEDVDDVDGFGNIFEARVGFDAEDFGFVGIDGNDFVADGLEVGGDSVGRAQGIRGETDDSDGFGGAEHFGDGVRRRGSSVGAVEVHSEFDEFWTCEVMGMRGKDIRYQEAACRERRDWRRDAKMRSFARKLRGLRMMGPGGREKFVAAVETGKAARELLRGEDALGLAASESVSHRGEELDVFGGTTDRDADRFGKTHPAERTNDDAFEEEFIAEGFGVRADGDKEEIGFAGDGREAESAESIVEALPFLAIDFDGATDVFAVIESGECGGLTDIGDIEGSTKLVHFGNKGRMANAVADAEPREAVDFGKSAQGEDVVVLAEEF